MATAEHICLERRFLLHGVPWQAYVTLRDLPENEHVRMTYDRGVLEMMSPSKFHEQMACLISRLIDAWTEECEVDIQSCGAVTFQREDLEQGLEPDKCYYVAHEPLVRNKRELDLAIDPPPDLAVEVDLGTGAIDKLVMYAGFRVPEVWRYDGQTLQVYLLGPEGRYVRSASSASFPQLPPAEIERVLRQLGTASETALVRSFRHWVRTTIRPESQ